MQTVLIATLPTTRQDGTALPPTAIASITFQKQSLTGTPPALGSEQTLVTNTAADPTVGLTPAQITFTDTSANVGDSYTCFVTDTAGNTSALSNAEVYPTAPPLAAPSAPALSATFS